MIDVEKMQKVNRLAQELVSHGMATDMDDAFRQADTLINKEQGTIPQRTPSASPSSSSPQQAEDSNWFFALQRLTKQLELQSRTIEELKATISSLQSDVLTVKSMQNMRAMQAASQVQQAPSPSFQTEEPRIEKQVSAPVAQNYGRPLLAQKGSGNPRCGVFTSDDVSIEKFFYAGPGGAKVR